MEVLYTWDNNTQVKWAKIEYKYDANNNRILYVDYLWDSESNTWIEGYTRKYENYYSTLNVSISPVYENQSSISVFPNPATDYIVVEGAAASLLTVFDFSGHVIHKQAITEESESISVSSWNSGTYLIVLQKGSDKTTKKIIKQ